MKNKNETQKQIFRLKFSPAILVLAIAVLTLCGVGIGISIWRIVRFGVKDLNDVIKYPFLIAVCVFCIALMIAILVKSQYIVDDEYFTTQYGFIKSKFAVRDVTSIVLDSDVKKLTIRFGEQYTVVSVSPEWNESLVRALLAVNPSIDYGFTLSDTPSDKDKK